MKKTQKQMLIANPIYDAVFKYLMEDTKAAKVLISAIIGQRIESLEIRPQEILSPSVRFGFTVLRIDFSAVIVNEEGKQRKVLIELQKSKKSADLPRFRKYLGDNYAKPDTQDPKGLPIVTIYFLGFLLETEQAGLHVARQYKDLFTGNPITDAPDGFFVERLTHDSYIVQVSRLRGYTRSRLELLLSIFDQRYVFRMKGEDRRWLLDLPEEVKEAGGQELDLLLSRLHRATLDEGLQDQVEVEETFDKQMDDKEQELEEALARAEEAQKRAEEERIRAEDAQQLMEQEKIQKEEAQQLMAQERIRAEEAQQREKTLQSMMAKMLHAQGKSVNEIALLLSINSETANILLGS